MSISDLPASTGNLTIAGAASESNGQSLALTSSNGEASTALAVTDGQDDGYDSLSEADVLFPDFLLNVREDPAGVVLMLRVLVQERAGASHSDAPRIQKRLDVLIYRLCNTLFLPAARLGPKTWPVLLQSGIHDAVVDCILRTGFFEESKVGPRINDQPQSD